MRWRRTWADAYEFDRLARFNSERARGIIHTPEWCAEMAREQRAFDLSRQRFVGASRARIALPEEAK